MTRLADLDYRFAWRWLLPLPANGQWIGLQGFDDAEQRFWQTALAPAEGVNAAREATVWLVDADRVAPESALAMNRLASVQTLAVVGHRAAITRWRRALRASFGMLREYGLLPAHQPRVVIPLDIPAHAVTALGLHQPGRRLARWGVWIARVLARRGWFFPLRRRGLLIAAREPGALPIGAVQADIPARLPEPGLCYALYLGSQDDNRKTVVLPLGRTEPSVILKVGATANAQRALDREAAALEALRESPIRIQIPRLIGRVDNDGVLTLFQEYRTRRPVSRQRMEDAVIDFLARLSTINRRSRPLAEVLVEIAPAGIDRIADPAPALLAAWRWLQTRSEQGLSVWEHRSHGDFAPWNCAWTESGLLVYDWEESREWDLALSDAFYYAVAPALHIGHSPNPAHTLQRTLALAGLVATQGGLEAIEMKLYLALWLCGQRGKHPGFDVLLKNWVPGTSAFKLGQ